MKAETHKTTQERGITMVAMAGDGGIGEDDVVDVGVLISSSLCPCGDVANIAKR